MILKTIKQFYTFPFLPRKVLREWGNKLPGSAQVAFVLLLFLLSACAAIGIGILTGSNPENRSLAISMSYNAGALTQSLIQIFVFCAFLFAVNSRWEKKRGFTELFYFTILCFVPQIISFYLTNGDPTFFIKLAMHFWTLVLLFWIVKIKFSFSNLRSIAIVCAISFLYLAAGMMLKGIEI